MQVGDKVRVYPHGAPEMARQGVVEWTNKDGWTMLVRLDNKRLLRVKNYGVGPWVDVRSGGHVEIELLE